MMLGLRLFPCYSEGIAGIAEEGTMPSSSSGLLSPYINGRFARLAKPERTFEAKNPARPADVLAVSGWNKDLVGEITDGMRQAHAAFQKLELKARMKAVSAIVDALRANSDELKSQMMLELARSRGAVDEEWALCEALFDILPGFCQEALGPKSDPAGWSWSYAPVGLCLLSANVALPMYSILCAVLPSLVAGNAVCVRPSLHCPLSASMLASCVHQAELPPGLFQLVYGDLEVYRRLLLSHQFDCVLYSGGEESLEQIRRDLSTNQNTRMVLCGGGKNGALVMPSCDVEAAAQSILYGCTVDAGQRLESTSLAFVHEKTLDAFLEAFVRQVKNMPIGVKSDLTDGSRHVMGPLCSAASWERYLRFQGIAARESQETLRWGKPIDNAGNGLFVSPGVHLMQADKVRQSVYASNAFFGPDVCIVPVSEAEQAVDILNDLQAARSLGVHTAFEEEVLRVRHSAIVPSVLWNAATTDIEPHLPTVGRGRAGNSYVTGVRFLFNTVYPRTLNVMGQSAGKSVVKAARALGVAGIALLAGLTSLAATSIVAPSTAHADYKKAVEGNDVVKGKFYPKAGRFQLNVGGGAILNQSFIDTYVGMASVTYHLSEWHAVSVEGFAGFSSDRNERTCVENFYADTKRAQQYGDGVGPCPTVADTSKDNASTPADPALDAAANPGNDKTIADDQKKTLPLARKPAYMAIRKVNAMGIVNYQWTPVYGKALWFLSAVGYLDLYANFGLGIAMSDYSPKVDTFVNAKGETKAVTDGVTNPDQYGLEGRPPVESQTSPVVSLGLGSRFFFAKYFMANVDLRNVTIVAKTGESSFMNFFAIWGGMGVIF